MAKLKVCIFGAGEIGSALAMALAANEDFAVQVIDRSEEALDRLRAMNIQATLKTFGHSDELQGLL
ncbi:MAG: saccharopine dehydrogenase NADP-binding domain-containing protein, partial [Clostridia bacterium]|nr:saccharopine dehydrogenase NADP-binding domain-containing protein [Clostridia bacterium]